MPLTPVSKKAIQALILKYFKKGYKNHKNIEIAEFIKKNHPNETKEIKLVTIERYIREARTEHGIFQESDISLIKSIPKPEESLKEQVKKFLRSPHSITEIANQFDKAPKEIHNIIYTLKEEKYNLVIKKDKLELSGNMQQGGLRVINLSAFENIPYKFGIISDNHLNSKYERLDILHACYDIFEKEGVRDVYNAGNWIDGEARFNKFDLYNHGITPQIEYFLDHYPQRDGITTHYIAGDDHEGWFVQREKIDIGGYAQLMAEKRGRFDLKYLGYVEADIQFKSPKGRSIMKIMHPGGGSAYALSYAPQKVIESFTGGEKPNILIIGHYHKADYMFYRNTHILQAACTQDQTPFLRKNKIQVSLGAWIVEMQQSKDGNIQRFKPEYLAFYDKGYYEKKGYYR